MPEPLDSLSDANVIGLEGIQSNAQNDGGGTEQPLGNGVNQRNAVPWEVVDDAGSGGT